MLTGLILLIVGIVLIAIIIAVNGYFVAQEFAYMSVDRPTLRAAAERGDVASERALKVTNRTSFMLSGAQLGITVTGLLVGFVAEPLVGEAIAIFLGVSGVPAAVGVTVGTVTALLLATIAQMLFAELFPKNLAIANPTPLARALARSTLIYLAAVGWLITIFDKASNALLRLIRVEPVHDLDSSATAEDLEHIVDDSRVSGDLSEDLSILIDRILDFPNRDVEHAMIPRSRSGVMTPDVTIESARAHMAVDHSRYPILGPDDTPIGTLHLEDVLLCAPTDTRSVSAIMRDPVVVSTYTTLPDALRLLTKTRNELACVIDEHGGFAGVLTIEDLAEELVGEITDEHDPDEMAAMEVLDTDRWRVDGDLPLDELERALGKQLPHGDFETVSGLLIATNGGLLGVGETVEVALPELGADYIEDVPIVRTLLAEVLAVDRFVPTSISLELRERPLRADNVDRSRDTAKPADAKSHGDADNTGGTHEDADAAEPGGEER